VVIVAVGVRGKTSALALIAKILEEKYIRSNEENISAIIILNTL
jgi:hypothetical protein